MKGIISRFVKLYMESTEGLQKKLKDFWLTTPPFSEISENDFLFDLMDSIENVYREYLDEEERKSFKLMMEQGRRIQRSIKRGI